MDSLRSLAAPSATVIRDSIVLTIPSPEVVVGDLVELKTGAFNPFFGPLNPRANRTLLIKPGDVVPADLRLVEAMNFETDEALLTGESLPVAKDCAASWAEEMKAGEGTFDIRDIAVGGSSSFASCFRHRLSPNLAPNNRSNQHGLHIIHRYERSSKGNRGRHWNEDGNWSDCRISSWW